MTYLERTQQTLINAHHGAGVIKLAAVIGSTEQCHELAFREEFVTVFNDLMGSADEVHVMLLQEAGHDIGPKGEGHTTVVFAPARDVFIGIGPEEIAQETAIGNLATVR